MTSATQGLAERMVCRLQPLLRVVASHSRASLRPLVLRCFLGLALPGALMMALESSSFDMNSVLAGQLGSPAITAAHSAMFGIIYLLYYAFTYAFSTASTIRQV